jgi:NitT/TauT family transport system ATP-binding protein
MHRILLDLWQAERRSLIFITHDLEEAIALADRVVILSAGPAASVVGEVKITLPRPRDVSALATTDEFLRLYRELWGLLGAEVEKSYRHQDVNVPASENNHKEHVHETQA